MINKALRIVSIVLIALGIVFACLGVWCMFQAFDKYYYYTMNYPRDCLVIEELGGMDKLSAQGQYFSAFGSMLIGVSGITFGVGAIIISITSKSTTNASHQ
jgi:hypothetical protein